MKAVVYREYGSPEVLRLEAMEQPVPANGELLVRVAACSVNPGDWDLLRGSPYVLRLTTGLTRPRNPVLGLAIAGRVESVGGHTSRFEVGDRVYAGIGRGGFAEFALAPEQATAAMPVNLTFAQAAAVPVAGVTALQALRDVGRVGAGREVLINGASGGVGTFAVQIAKALGAEVTAVSSTANVELLRSLGADHVVDYRREDFTAGGPRYDVILDNVGNRRLSECRRALKPNGTLIPNSNKGDGRWLGTFLTRAIGALVVSPFVSQRLRPFAATENGDDLAALTELIEAGQLTPVVDRTLPLEDTAEALTYYGQGHSRGKVVVTIAEE